MFKNRNKFKFDIYARTKFFIKEFQSCSQNNQPKTTNSHKLFSNFIKSMTTEKNDFPFFVSKKNFSNKSNLSLIINKENNLSNYRNKDLTSEVSFTQEIKKLKTLIEIMLSKDGEKDIDIIDLKRYFYLCNKTKDFIDKNITDSHELNAKIIKIIESNKDLKKTNELTKYLLFDIEYEKNDFYFKSLLVNSLLNINLEDKEIESFYFLKDIRYNLLSVNPKIFLRSKFLIEKLRSLLGNFTKNKNYSAVEVIDLVILSNILKRLSIDVFEEEFFYYISEKIFKNELKVHLDMLYTIDNIENKSDYLYNVFEFFKFFTNYKENLSSHNVKENSFKLSFADKVDIKKMFLEFYSKLFLKNFSNCIERQRNRSNQDTLESVDKEESIKLENEIIFKDKGKIKIILKFISNFYPRINLYFERPKFQ